MSKTLCIVFYSIVMMSALASFVSAAEPDVLGVAPALPQAGETNPGSVLIYNFYSSNATEPDYDTSFHLTNTSRAENAFVHLFFIDGGTCAVTDSFICLTPNQTATFLASAIDPGTTGYVIAVATDRATGCPVQFNNLLGSAYVKLPRGHQAKLPAIAIPALRRDNCRAATAEAELLFNDREYARLPRVLALDEISSSADGNSTMLVLNSPGGNLSTGAQALGVVFGVLFDDAENAFAFTAAPATSPQCQIRRMLSDSFPITAPVFSAAIPSGRSGWLRVALRNPKALTGAAINFNPNSATVKSAFNGGANLNPLRYVETASITIPVFPPSC